MIIDLILNRKDGQAYNPKKFYNDVLNYGEQGQEIAKALDSGEAEDIKRELNAYIMKNDYNPAICEWVNLVNWL